MNLLCASAKSMSKTREDFPEPLTPVTTVKLRLGILTSTFLRLCSRAPTMLMNFNLEVLPDKYPDKITRYPGNRPPPGRPPRGTW